MSHAALLVALDEGPKAKQTVESLVEWQLSPFDENGRCFKEGSRWDWWKIGGRYAGSLGDKDIVSKGDVNTETLLAMYEKQARESWAAAKKEEDQPFAGLMYGVEDGDTEEKYVARHTNLSFYAFLRNRNWHENERLGWFGGTAKAECEIANDGKEVVGKCLHEIKRKHVIARVIVWNEPAEKWKQKFWKRFVEPLPDSTLLVVVDYHV